MSEPKKKVQNAGSKGGKFYINSKGEVVYGEKPKGKDNERIYDHKKEFKDQFPTLQKFNDMAKEKGLPEISAEDYKQLYQREHKAYMKNIKEAKAKGEDVKGFDEKKKDFLLLQVSADWEAGGKPTFEANSWADVQTNAEHQKIEITKEEYMKFYKQQHYQHQKNLKAYTFEEAKKKSEAKAKQAEDDQKKADKEDKKKAKEEEEKKKSSIVTDGLEVDNNKFPELEGTWKMNGWAWKVRYKLSKQSEKFKDNIDKLDEDEKNFLSGKMNEIFKNKDSSFWIGHDETKSKSKADKIDDYLKEGLNEKDTEKLNSILEKVNPKAEPKPIPEEEKLENYKSKYLKNNGSMSDRFETKNFPPVKGGTEKQNDSADYARNMFSAYTASAWFKERQMMAGMTERERGAINKAFDNLWDNTSAKFWNKSKKENDTVDGLTDMLRESLDNEAKVHFDSFIEKAKKGKAEADAEKMKKIKEEAKAKAEADAKKKAQDKADAEAKAEADKKAKENEDSPDYQKAQVKKISELANNQNELKAQISNIHGTTAQKIEKIQKDILGYNLTDLEKKNLRIMMDYPSHKTVGSNTVHQALADMITAKINPETGTFNKNIYDNFIRESQKSINEVLDSKIEKDHMKNTINTAVEHLNSTQYNIDPSSYVKYEDNPSKQKHIKNISEDILKNGGDTNSQILSYMQEKKKKLTAEVDVLRSLNYNVSYGTGGASNYHKFTDDEKVTAKEKELEFKTMDDLVNTVALFSTTKNKTSWESYKHAKESSVYLKPLFPMNEEQFNKAKAVDDAINKHVLYTKEMPEDVIGVTGINEIQKKTKSQGLKNSLLGVMSFYNGIAKKGIFNNSIVYENSGSNAQKAWAIRETNIKDANYGKDVVHVSFSKADEDTYAHEIGHCIANQNQETIGFASSMFLAGRSDKLGEYHLSNLGFSNDGYAKPDSFINGYVGRDYYKEGKPGGRYLGDLKRDGQHNEVISQGVQEMYRDAVGFMVKDPEHFALTHSVLKGNVK